MKAKTYKYSRETIARAAGVSSSKVRKDVREGVFRPDELLSTSAYVMGIYLRRAFGVGANRVAVPVKGECTVKALAYKDGGMDVAVVPKEKEQVKVVERPNFFKKS